MQRGICYQGYLPLRKEPSDRAEMVSQVLFGERFDIIRTEGSWALIKANTDQKEAWLEKSGFQMLREGENPEDQQPVRELMAVSPLLRVRDKKNSRTLLLPAGSVLDEGSFFEKESDEGWIIPGPDIDVATVGKMLVSLPAIRGGCCGFGFDAPGLVKLLRKSQGLEVPHSIEQQAIPGTIINFLHEAARGDLAFFQDNDALMIHVGMVLGDGKIIHASDQVRIDRLDQQGIYCEEKDAYTHRLRIIKSLRHGKG